LRPELRPRPVRGLRPRLAGPPRRHPVSITNVDHPVRSHLTLGLRALFFLVKGLLDRLVYLSTGLSLILAFIGVKLILHVDISPDTPEISTPTSLVVILVVLVVVTVASLVKTRNDPTAKAHAGSLKAHRPARADETRS
jgi:tellurite resistance protein TerC